MSCTVTCNSPNQQPSCHRMSDCEGVNVTEVHSLVWAHSTSWNSIVHSNKHLNIVQLYNNGMFRYCYWHFKWHNNASRKDQRLHQRHFIPKSKNKIENNLLWHWQWFLTLLTKGFALWWSSFITLFWWQFFFSFSYLHLSPVGGMLTCWAEEQSELTLMCVNDDKMKAARSNTFRGWRWCRGWGEYVIQQAKKKIQQAKMYKWSKHS